MKRLIGESRSLIHDSNTPIWDQIRKASLNQLEEICVRAPKRKMKYNEKMDLVLHYYISSIIDIIDPRECLTRDHSNQRVEG
jgi:hypothetical protein